MNSIPAWLATTMIAAILVIGLLLLHKVRRIHVATYDLVTQADIDNLFRQIQAYLSLERLLAMSAPLPPVRGFAGSPDFLAFIASRVLARKPQTVVECSSGVSTIVIARCLQRLGAGHVWSLEHHPDYAARSRHLIAQYDLADYATVVDAPLAPTPFGTPWYSLGNLPVPMSIEMLIIDGPPMSTAHQARYPAIPMMLDYLHESAEIILDDASRPEERETLARWSFEYPEFSQVLMDFEKGGAHLQRRQ